MEKRQSAKFLIQYIQKIVLPDIQVAFSDEKPKPTKRELEN